MIFESESRTFSGKWITTDEFRHLPINRMFHRQLEDFPQDGYSLETQNKHVLFRRKFTMPENFNTSPVICYITADDYYKLYVNGTFVGQGPAPGYHFHYFYNQIDITDFLRPGENTLAIHTYYQGLINRVWVSGDNRHGLLLDLVQDGKTLLCSDESFKMREHSGFSIAGTAGYLTQYLERYDAGALEVGFETPEFDDQSWESAKVEVNADYRLFSQPSKQLCFEEVLPVKIERYGNRMKIDFGGIYVGALRMAAAGNKGDEITLYFGQELNDDSTVRHQLRANCNYIEYFQLSGNKKDILNQYDYKAFRYVELEFPDSVVIDEKSLIFCIRHYPFELRAAPNRNDEISLQIWELCVSTLRYGVQDAPLDCMEREKGYYLGDGCYSLLTVCLLTQDYTLMEKFFDDFLRTSFINRGLMTCGNCSFMQEIAEYPLIMINLLMEYLCLTGNSEFVADRFAAFADILDFYREEYAQSNGLLANLDKWCVVEWPINMRDGYDVDITQGKICTSMHNVINAYYIGAIKSLNKVARMLKMKPYADIAPLQLAFVETFYDAERKLFKDSATSSHISMPGNVYAYFFELGPDAEFKRNMLEMVRQKRLTQCLLFETFPLLCSLIREGEGNLAHDLLTDQNTWRKMLSEDATRTFEAWNKDLKWNTSLFHLTLSFGAAFLMDWDIAGIFSFD